MMSSSGLQSRVDLAGLQSRAGRGDARAAYILGAYHGSGAKGQNGIVKDEAQAANYYRMGAEQGDAEAAYSMGICFHTGSGVEQDEDKAVQCYQKAAGQGHLEAQKSLARRFAVSQPALATRYCRLAAEQGDVDMMFQAAEAYDNGRGIARDRDKAYHFYKLAQKNGHAGADALVKASSHFEYKLSPPWGRTWE